MEDLDLAAVCRVCLTNHKEMYIAADVGVIEKLFDCASVQLPSESLICQLCKTEVDKWHSFKQQVLKSVQVVKYIEESHENMKRDSAEDINYAVIEEYFIKVEVEDEVEPEITSLENEVNTSTNIFKCEICEKVLSSSSELCCCKEDAFDPPPQEEDIFDPLRPDEDTPVILSPKLEPDDSKKFQCNLCHKSFISENVLTWHKKIHSALKSDQPKNSVRFPCSLCPMIYDKKPSLIDHMRWKHNSCSKKSKYSTVCGECGLACKSKCEYRVHMRSHNDEKPYKCDTCKMNFYSLDNLVIHYTIHTPYVCRSCGRGYKKLSGFLCHQSSQ